MKKIIVCIALGAMLLALCMPAEAQQPNKFPRIGLLSSGSPSSTKKGVEEWYLGQDEFVVNARRLNIDLQSRPKWNS